LASGPMTTSTELTKLQKQVAEKSLYKLLFVKSN